jgi:hypothetical protein
MIIKRNKVYELENSPQREAGNSWILAHDFEDAMRRARCLNREQNQTRQETKIEIISLEYLGSIDVL